MVIKMFIEIARLYNLMMYVSNPNLGEKGGFYPPPLPQVGFPLIIQKQ